MKPSIKTDPVDVSLIVNPPASFLEYAARVASPSHNDPRTSSALTNMQAITERLAEQKFIAGATTQQVLALILENVRPVQIDKVAIFRDDENASWVFTLTQQNRPDELMKHVEPLRAVLEGLGLNHVSVHHSRAPRRLPYTRHSFNELRVVVPFLGNPQIHEAESNG